MPTDVPISHLISKLGSPEPAPGVGGGNMTYCPLDEGEIAAATLVAYGAAAMPDIIKATNSDNWIVRYRCSEVMRILGLEAVLPTLVELMSDKNLHVQQSAMLALLGDSGAEVTGSKCLSSISDFVEFCHSASRFDILDLLVRCGTKETRTHIERLLKQHGPFSRRTVLDQSLDYARKKQILEALKIDIRRLCEEIKTTGTEQERMSAAQLLQYCQLVRPGSAPTYLIPATFSLTPNASRELVRSSDISEQGAAPLASSTPKKNLLSRVTLPNLLGGWRSKRAPATLPVPSVEEYTKRTHGRRCLSSVAGMTMILIPAGDFLMGDEDQRTNPRRTVYLDAYWISQHPVTVKQYLQFCSETDHARPEEPHWHWRDEDPVVNVSWNDAQDYCKWASQKGVPIRLPTEQEWEKAARGLSGLKYPWGDEWDGKKCVNSVRPQNAQRTESVHSHPEGASPYGVMHMSGNVWEWCADWYDTSHNSRVMRGGSWVNLGFLGSDDFRASCRGRGNPFVRNVGVGFRAVAGPSPPKSPSDLTR